MRRYYPRSLEKKKSCQETGKRKEEGLDLWQQREQICIKGSITNEFLIKAVALYYDNQEKSSNQTYVIEVITLLLAKSILFFT